MSTGTSDTTTQQGHTKAPNTATATAQQEGGSDGTPTHHPHDGYCEGMSEHVEIAQNENPSGYWVRHIKGKWAEHVMVLYPTLSEAQDAAARKHPGLAVHVL
jgi:hypothetical protein